MTARPPARATPLPFDARPTRVGANALLPEVLAGLGADPAAMFARAGLPPSSLADADAMIAMADLARLIAAAAAVAGRTDIGLLVAAAAGTRFTGLLLPRMARARDLGAALEILVLLLPVNTRPAVMRLTSNGEEAALEIAVSQPFGPVATVFEEAIAGITCQAVRQLLGGDWAPRRVQFAHPATTSAAAYQAAFGAPVRCSAPQTAILMPASDLARPLLARQLVTAASDAALRAAAAQLGLDVVDRVRAAIRRQLADPDLTRNRVAAQIATSPRSLNRHLAARGTSFAGLLREMRVDAACQLLAQTRLPLATIAAAVGYADQAAFSRAFRAGTGVTPRRWRDQAA